MQSGFAFNGRNGSSSVGLASALQGWARESHNTLMHANGELPMRVATATRNYGGGSCWPSLLCESGDRKH